MKVFATTFEDMEQLQTDYDLTDGGMSGQYFGWHWYYDDKAYLNVFFKLGGRAPDWNELEKILER